jgi:hypothetical protein
MRTNAELWRCDSCGRAFANRHQAHACGRWTLNRHFAGRSEVVREIYDRFLAMFEECGPVTVLPEKTRIAFQVRMSFAQLTVRRDWVVGHLVLARRVEDPVFTKVESFSPSNHAHHFRLDAPEQVKSLEAYARETYAVGCQEHLRRDPRPPRPVEPARG